MRIGIGYDIHRLEPGRGFVIGGVELPVEFGPVGHSDGDALLHAIIDALLGAAALGEIGGQFPSHDPRWKDADSLDLLRRVRAVIEAAGWRVENIDANVIVEAPRLAPYMAAMRGRIAEALGLDVAQVSVKAKSNDRLGAIGEGLAIAAQAVALLEKR